MPDQVVTTTTSAKLLGVTDFLKALLISVISAVITFLATSWSSGKVVFDWTAIGSVAAIAAVSYLMKNIGTPPQTTITPPPGTQPGETVTVKIPAPGQKIVQTVTPKP